MRIDERTADAKAMDWDMLCIKHHGTVHLITDDEWDEIFGRYLEQCFKMAGYNLADKLLLTATMPFSTYLAALISLTGEGR